MVPEPTVFNHVTLPEAHIYNEKAFPLCLTPPDDRPDLKENTEAVVSYFKTHSAHVYDLLRSHGVLFFRDFASESSTPQMFADIVSKSLGLENFPYALGNAVRTAVVDQVVFTANESPPEKPIPFHHELAQTPLYPSKLLFYCEKTADTGGETPILLSGQVYNDLATAYPSFLEKLETKGVIYSRIMTPRDRPESAIGRGWRGTFHATCREQAEERLAAKGYEWEWIGDGEDANLKEKSPALAAVVETNGRKAFFNQIYAVWGGWRDEFNTPENCVIAGDGTPLDAEAMQGLGQIMMRHEVSIPWQKGDFMFIDNMQAQHSRKTFTGKRRVLASLAK